MIIVQKKKTLFILAAVLVVLSIVGGVTAAVLSAEAEAKAYCIVLDAGHGGIDNGVSGVTTKQTEAAFNLAMVKLIGKRLEERGNIRVVYTRESEKGLSDEVGKSYKKEDMKARKKVITDCSPDLMVSIHANKFPDSQRRGAQVFFEEFSGEGKLLANALQASLNTLNKATIDKEYSALRGDYFMLKCSSAPSAIVECGFLSNPEDDKLLATEEYRDKLSLQITNGILSYLGSKQAPTFDTVI